MRVLEACLVGFLGLGALATMGACSDSTDMGAAGAGGATAAAGSGGKASGGGGTTSAGGGPSCTFLSTDCSSCLEDSCAALLGACTQDDTCSDALETLTLCACNPSMEAMDCQATFHMTGGDKAVKLIECYTLNSCADVCE